MRSSREHPDRIESECALASCVCAHPDPKTGSHFPGHALVRPSMSMVRPPLRTTTAFSADHQHVNLADPVRVARRNQLVPRSTVDVLRVHLVGAVLDRRLRGVVQAHVCLLLTAHGYIISGGAPLNEQDAVVVAVLCAVLQPILIAVQWPSLSVPVLACRALFLQIRRNRLLPQVEREICQSPHSSVMAGSPTNQ